MKKTHFAKKRPLWTTAIAIIGVFGMLIFTSGCSNNGSSTAQNNADSASIMDVHENNSAVNAFITFVSDDQNKMSLDHAYTSTALNKLTEAVDGMAGEVGYDIRVDLDKAKECAAKITKDPNATTHADDIRNAAEILSTSLKNMQQAKYPPLESDAEAVQQAASAINPEVLTLDQKDAIKSFFSKAAGLLQKMN